MKGLKHVIVCVALSALYMMMLGGIARSQSAEEWYRLGLSESQKSSFSKAIPFFSQAQKLNPELPGLAEAYGTALLALSRPSDAIAQFVKALANDPENASLYFQLSVCYELTFQHKEAVYTLREALKRNPTAVSGYVRLAALEMRLGNHQESRHALETVLEELKRTAKTSPDSAEVFLNLGMGYLLFGEWDEVEHALAVLERLGSPLTKELKTFITEHISQSKREIDELKYLLKQKPKDPELFQKLGGAYIYLKQYSDAEAMFLRVLSIDSTNAASYRSLGYLYLRLKRQDDASKMFERAVNYTPETSPEILGLLAHLGHCELSLNKNKPALQAFQRSLSVAEKMTSEQLRKFTTELAYTYYGIAIARLNLERENEVRWVGNPFSFRFDQLDQKSFSILPPHLRRFEPIFASIRDATRLKPDFAEAYALLGVVHLHTGNQSAAANAYREAIRIKPDFAEAYAGLGASLARLGNDDAAIAHVTNAIAQKKDYTDAYALLAKLLERRNRIKEAIEMYEKWIEAEPQSEIAHYEVGLLYGKVGNVQMLLKHYYILDKLKSAYAEKLYTYRKSLRR